MENLVDSTSKKTNHRSLWLEIFKVFLFACVAWIHVGNNTVFFQLARISVPMFFVISGCYCYTKRKKGEDDTSFYERKVQIAKKKLLSMVRYLAFGYVFYFLFDIIFKGFVLGGNLAKIFKGFFVNDILSQIFIFNHVDNSGGHMWFLLALFAVSLLHYFIVKYRVEKMYFFLPLLIIVFFFFAVYLNVYEGDVVWGDMTRNGLFLGLPCFALGFDTHYLVNKFVDTKAKKIVVCLLSLALGVTLFFLQLVEWEHLHFNAECYISGFLACPFLMAFFLLCPSPDPKYFTLITGKGLSFFAYIYHVAVFNILDTYVQYPGQSRPYIVIVVSIVCAILTHWIIVGIVTLFKKIRKNKPVSLSLN